MVRPKRKVDPMKRVEKDILKSRCFKRMVDTIGEDQFMDFAKSKIHPIQGDLIVEKLGISPEDRKILTDNLHVIINSAASVNFDDPLQEAIKINYYGC